MIKLLLLGLLQFIRLPMLAIWHLQGWRMESPLPDTPKFIVLGVPHTTNWDYWHMLCMSIRYYRFPNVTMKKEWIDTPVVGQVLKAMGAIPVQRDKNTNMIDVLADFVRHEPRVMLVFTPEGSRRYTEYWRTGFYYVAHKSDVPIICAYADYKRKRAGFGLVVHPTGDIHADFEKIKAYYEVWGRNGLYPENVTRLALKD